MHILCLESIFDIIDDEVPNILAEFINIGRLQGLQTPIRLFIKHRHPKRVIVVQIFIGWGEEIAHKVCYRSFGAT